MEFIHRPYIPKETIAAIATPLGEGAIAIIRISGVNAIHIGSKIFSSPVETFLSHTVHYGHILNSKNEKIDEALLLIMKGTKSFTGEDTIEIQCHGGTIAARRVLEVVIEAGARLACPGEFTLKAFMNGKLDLAQAEAIQQLIGAKNTYAFELASENLRGGLSEKIESFQQRLTKIAAILEAWVDFPEEGIEFAPVEILCQDLEKIANELDLLAQTYHDGKKIQEGIKLTIIGSPNVGKSSLMNALLKRERAIVTAIAGTTRDILEEDLLFNGLHFRLTDTAGIRETEEIVEKEGIRRSIGALKEADLVLFVLDVTEGLRENEKSLLRECALENTLVVWNKTDLPHPPLPFLDCKHVIEISAQQKTGIDSLKEAIEQLVWTKGVRSKEEILLTSLRHKEAIVQAKHYVAQVFSGLKENVSPEFLTFDLRQSLHHLGLVLGTNVSEDILSSIFSQFCIGK